MRRRRRSWEKRIVPNAFCDFNFFFKRTVHTSDTNTLTHTIVCCSKRFMRINTREMCALSSDVPPLLFRRRAAPWNDNPLLAVRGNRQSSHDAAGDRISRGGPWGLPRASCGSLHATGYVGPWRGNHSPLLGSMDRSPARRLNVEFFYRSLNAAFMMLIIVAVLL